MSTDPFVTATDVTDVTEGPGRITGGRYRLPDLTIVGDDRITEPGERRGGWRRVTTLARVASDAHALADWRVRQVILGLVAREDLYDAACGVVSVMETYTSPNAEKINRQGLDELAERAMVAAGSDAGATTGTALHDLSRGVDASHEPRVRRDLAPRVDAYRAAVRTYGLTVIPEFSERIVVLLRHGLAGRLDKVVRDPSGGVFVADLKTQRRFYGWAQVAAQVAAYQAADAMWDAESLRYVDPPVTDPGTGIVMWVPVRPDPDAPDFEVRDVDLAYGREVLDTCARLVALRSDGSRTRQTVCRLRELPSPRSGGDPLADVEAFARRLRDVGTLAEGAAVWREIVAAGQGGSPELLSLAGDVAGRLSGNAPL